MGFTAQTFAQLQALLATQYSAVANTAANTDPGSTLGSIFNACALMTLQQQNGIVYANSLSRLGTSAGADVDSFVNPFGITRLGAEASTGTVTFSSSSPASQQIVVLLGTIVQTTGNLQFQVIADNNQSAYNASLGGYVINPGQNSCNATVQCLAAGAVSNVQANTVTQLYGGPNGQPITGVSSVNNSAAFASGRDPETDQELITRFTQTMSSGTVSTSNALSAAVLGVQPGLTYSICDQIKTDGTLAPGYVTVLIAQLGTGTTPSSTLISAAQAAVNKVRSAGITSTVIAPTLLPVNVTATLHAPTNAIATTVQSAATTAIQNYINNIGLDPAGAAKILPYIDVGMTLRNVTNVSRVDSLTINSGNSDLTTTFPQMFVAGTISLTIVQP